MSVPPEGNAAAVPSNQMWKSPSANHQQKYSLQPLPDDFSPTQQESALLQFYESIRSYERTASRLKDAAARARLAAREAEFQKLADKKKRKKKKRSSDHDGDQDEDELMGSDDDDDDDDDSAASDSDNDNSDEEEDEAAALKRKHEEKMKKKREAMEAKLAAEANEEELRQELLAGASDMGDQGPMLKKKKVEPTAEKSSLIASIVAATPPHEFSKKMELSPLTGKKLFPPTASDEEWSPSPEASNPHDGELTLELDGFDVSQAQNGLGNNTVAIKFMAPEKSRRFSLNIGGPHHDNFHSVLFHFNPRHFERGGQLVLNNKKEGMWGQAINVPLSTVPVIFGQPACTLIIQINGEGFDTFLDGKHIARLEHRRELASGSQSLFLNFPATDDYNKPESWTVYKVWWGNKPSLAKGDLSSVAGYKSFNSVHPRKLFVSKLKKVKTDPEVDLRRAELERVFGKYGGARGCNVSVQKHSTFAFVEYETERQADMALQELSSQYRINRARRTRHEALQEERLASEKAKSVGKKPQKKESSDWD